MSTHTTIMDRIDTTTRIPSSHITITPPAPRSVKIELTGVCNLRCGFCAINSRECQPTEPMPWDMLERLIRECREFGIREVGFFYIGESFTTMQTLIPAIKLARELGFENRFLTSNATISFPDRVQEVIEAGLTSLKWSVNFVNPQQFAEVTQRPERLFRNQLANIKAAKAIRDEIFERTGHRCELSASRIQFHDEQKIVMDTFFKEHVVPYVDNVYELPLYTMGGSPIDREVELGMTPTAGNMGRIGGLVAPLPCWAVFNEAHITFHNGIPELSACCFDARGDWIMADLRTATVKEGWNSQKFQELRGAHLSHDVRGTVCETCAMYG